MAEKQIEKINNVIVTEFAKTIEMFDLSPSEARLFSILYLEGKPMTLDEMSKALGKSKTSISMGIRNLLDLNLVSRVWKKGVRKDLYVAEESLYKKFMTSFIHKWLEATTRQKLSLKEIEKDLEVKKELFTGEEMDEEFYEAFSRLKEMIAFHQSIEKAFKQIKPPSKFHSNIQD
ncbi:GbsR/MarR family transcriptional regulator [Aquibacillus salsiterrae]|uniref:HTH-type transcriptional regulator n=1 Tax=Aquibacillus salsiterrae TaxID=2950439 RepID=A0A9X3WH06_9BACI|nr:transcriptional regulator [Aquibacillus salsiterrae]MDC3417274.1 transcriptional regulator [Aquibacillus salsiterrae]